MFDPAAAKLSPETEAIQAHIVSIDGLASGGRRRAPTSDGTVVSVTYLDGIAPLESNFNSDAIERIARFPKAPVLLQ